MWGAGLFASPVSGQLEQRVTRCVSAPYTNSSRAANSFVRKPRLMPRGAAWDRTQVVALQNMCSVEKASQKWAEVPGCPLAPKAL